MNEGWHGDTYLIVLTQDESAAAMTAYGFNRFLPGYTLVGLRSWIDFIVVNQVGAMYTVPTVLLDPSLVTAFPNPQHVALEADEGSPGKSSGTLSHWCLAATRQIRQMKPGSRISSMPSSCDGGTRDIGLEMAGFNSRQGSSSKDLNIFYPPRRRGPMAPGQTDPVEI